MGKRQKRIFRNQFTAQKAELVGKVAAVITNDNRTVRGTILELKAEELYLIDMSRQPQQFAINAIAEIVLDFEADY